MGGEPERDETNQMWRDYHAENRQRLDAQRDARLEELRTLLPVDVQVKEVNGPGAVQVFGRGRRLTYYAMFNKVQRPSGWSHMTPADIAALFSDPKIS